MKPKNICIFILFFFTTLFFVYQILKMTQRFNSKEKSEKSKNLFSLKFPKLKILVNSEDGKFLECFRNIRDNFDSVFMDNHFEFYVFVDKLSSEEYNETKMDDRLKIINYEKISHETSHSKVKYFSSLSQKLTDQKLVKYLESLSTVS
jgi:hypothetical protein